jgi:hypothetical protein
MNRRPSEAGTWNILVLYRVMRKALKEVEATTGKPRQRTERSGKASLGRSRLERGCRTNMTRGGHVVAVQVPMWWSLDFNCIALYVHTHFITCILIIGGGHGPPRAVEPMVMLMMILITEVRRM